MAKTERVLGARRLSRDTDASTSIERQGEKINLAVKMRDGAVLVALTEDVDVSGSVDPFKREQLGPWLSDRDLIAQWDTLIVTKLDRLTRSIRDLDALIRWCERHGKTLVSLAESVDLSTPTGRMMVKLTGVFAEWELERISERNRESREAATARGWWHGGTGIPWGYRTVKVESHWELAPDDGGTADEARTTVAAVLAGASVQAMADRLKCDDKGLMSRLRSRTLTGHVEFWRPAADGEEFTRRRTVKDKETGESVTLVPDVVRDDDGMPIRREPIISDEDWTRLQTALDGRKLRRVNKFDSPPLLHIARCADCGRALYANQTARKGGGVYRYYRHDNDHKVTCSRKTQQVRAADIEPQLEAELIRRFGRLPVLDEIEHPAQDSTAELAKVNGAIAEWEDKAIAGDAAGSVIRILDGLHAKRTRLEGMPQSEAWTEYIDTGRDLSDDWEEWGTAERNAYLRRMGVRVLCAKGKPPVFEFGKLGSSREIDWNALMAKAG